MKITYFKNRVSFYNLLGVALLMLVIFISIYITVSLSVNYDINKNLDREINIHQAEISARDGIVSLVPEGEWEEPEHQTVFMNPVFVEIYNADKKLMEKSPNLREKELLLTSHQGQGNYTDTFIDSIPIRQVQTPLLYNGKTVGYAVIAMSIESETRVLSNLKYNLFLTYPICLVILFFLTRIIAARSIRPALTIIDTTRKITDTDFSQRIELPKRKDELYTLSVTINELLDRVENAITREKQFTTDASHELRTPLAILKGTLEVLIRKPRDSNEYIDKIGFCIQEADRINSLVEQLLMLARFENHDKITVFRQVALDEILHESLERYAAKITERQLKVTFSVNRHFYVLSDTTMLSIIVDNLLSNAIKYSQPSGKVVIKLDAEGDRSILCSISDNGIGIAQNDIENIYDQFYRSEATEHSQIKGSGLGLSIVKKLTTLLGIQIFITSKKGVGSTVVLRFES